MYSHSDTRTTYTKSAAHLKPIPDESSEEDDTTQTVPGHVKRKAPTECRNIQFVKTIHQRALSNS